MVDGPLEELAKRGETICTGPAKKAAFEMRERAAQWLEQQAREYRNQETVATIETLVLGIRNLPIDPETGGADEN